MRMPLSCLSHRFLIHITVSTCFMSFDSFMDVRWLRLIWGNSIYPAFYISIQRNEFLHPRILVFRKKKSGYGKERMHELCQIQKRMLINGIDLAYVYIRKYILTSAIAMSSSTLYKMKSKYNPTLKNCV